MSLITKEAMMTRIRAKRIGLLGGTSWESTLEYYRLINQRTGAVMGGNYTAELLLWSFDFGEVLDLLASDSASRVGAQFEAAAKGLAGLGAELLVICSNTGHQRADLLEAAAGIPVVHIADAVGAEIRRRGCSKAGLLGTLATMQGTFYKDRLRQRWGVETVVPSPEVQARVHEIAIMEVSRGKKDDGSRRELIGIVNGLCAEGVILGCTELPLLVCQDNVQVPVFDTLSLHVDAIVERALG
jgi:aspartate racemase